MNKWRLNYINGKPFPDTRMFDGVHQYRIAAECNGYVLGVTEKGNCAVWSGGYNANGELREVNGGTYFTGAEYGDDPQELFANAFACFNDKVEKTQEKDYELIFYQYDDRSDFTEYKQYHSQYSAQIAGEYQLVNGTCYGFAVYCEQTQKFNCQGEFPAKKYFNQEILQKNGYSIEDEELDLTEQAERGR